MASTLLLMMGSLALLVMAEVTIGNPCGDTTKKCKLWAKQGRCSDKKIAAKCIKSCGKSEGCLLKKIYEIVKELDASTDPTATNPGLAIAGGAFQFGDASKDLLSSVEFWSPNSLSCNLPDLPSNMTELSLSFLQEKLVACHDDECLILSHSFIPPLFPSPLWLPLQNTLHSRRNHTGTVIDNKYILLAGGASSPNTTELMPVDGSASLPSFPLYPGRYAHCAIKVGESAVIMTGGFIDEAGDVTDSVIQYSDIAPLRPVTEAVMTPLNEARAFHACGMFDSQGTQTLIVAGGYDFSFQLDSTETYDYSNGGTNGTWITRSPLPSTRSAWTGVNLAGTVYVVGGSHSDEDFAIHYLDEVLVWNDNTTDGAWDNTNVNMKAEREYPGIAAVPLSFILPFCVAP